jgi:hypothetical protein
MRVLAGSLACVSLIACASTAPPVIDQAPWQVTKDAPWVDKRLVNWGYVPATHLGKNYYCLVGQNPQVGSRLPLTKSNFCGDETYVLRKCWTDTTLQLGGVRPRRLACGDADEMVALYNVGWRPTYLVYGDR